MDKYCCHPGSVVLLIVRSKLSCSRELPHQKIRRWKLSTCECGMLWFSSWKNSRQFMRFNPIISFLRVCVWFRFLPRRKGDTNWSSLSLWGKFRKTAHAYIQFCGIEIECNASRKMECRSPQKLSGRIWNRYCFVQSNRCCIHTAGRFSDWANLWSQNTAQIIVCGMWSFCFR